jgi:hypothetical protein
LFLGVELLVLIPTFALVVIYVGYKEWLNIAYRQWLAELVVLPPFDRTPGYLT